MTQEELTVILKAVEEKFDSNISTSTGDFYGDTLSFLEGKDDFFKELKEELEKLLS